MNNTFNNQVQTPTSATPIAVEYLVIKKLNRIFENVK